MNFAHKSRRSAVFQPLNESFFNGAAPSHSITAKATAVFSVWLSERCHFIPLPASFSASSPLMR